MLPGSLFELRSEARFPPATDDRKPRETRSGVGYLRQSTPRAGCHCLRTSPMRLNDFERDDRQRLHRLENRIREEGCRAWLLGNRRRPMRPGMRGTSRAHGAAAACFGGRTQGVSFDFGAGRTSSPTGSAFSTGNCVGLGILRQLFPVAAGVSDLRRCIVAGNRRCRFDMGRKFFEAPFDQQSVSGSAESR
jgi:hypothetical protein